LAEESISRMSAAGFETGTLAKDLAGTAKTVRESGLSLEDWTKAVDAGTESATDLEKAWADVQLKPGDVNAQNRLAREAYAAAEQQARSKGGGTQMIKEILQTAMTTETGKEIPALQQAQSMAQQRAPLTDAEMGRFRLQGQTIQTGKRAERMLASPAAAGLTETVRGQLQSEADAGIAAQAEKLNQVRSFLVQQRRMEEDFNRQRERMEESFQRSQQYAAEDYGKQRRYMIQDYHRSVLRAEEDFHTQRMRAQRDFDKQVKRQSEETAKNMFDPYQRIAPQFVTDIDILQQNLLEQNQSVSDQLAGVQQLSGMGLSKDAIDQLKLMDPTQNQQVQRLLADAVTNPNGINEINKLIQERLKLGTELNTSEFNKQFQNMKADFATSMDDMGDDFEKNMKRGEQDFKRGLSRNADAFATTQRRAAEQHQIALDQMAEDNQRAHERQLQDFTEMGDEYAMSYAEIEKTFLVKLSELPSAMLPATLDAIKAVLQAQIKALDDAKTAATKREFPQGNGPVESAPPSGGGGSGDGGGGGTVPGPSEGGGDKDLAQFFLDRIGDSSIIGLGAGRKNPSWHDVSYACLQNVAWAKRYLGDTVHHTGYPTAESVGRALKLEKKMHGGYNAPAGALYWWDGSVGGQAGHVAVSDGRGNAINNWGGNSIEKNRVARMSPRGYRGWSTYAALASGGIVEGPTRALVGEAGREAIIPLNDKGARYLADAISKSSMGRYWMPLDAQHSRTESYSTPVTNTVYTYDQRTQFSGPVSVASQDPEEMARKLAARERRNRLARKTGSVA